MRECSIQELAQHLRDGQAKGRQPSSFCLFLGAGASIAAGIPGTDGMMRRFRANLQERWQSEGAKSDFESWLTSRQTWSSEYSEYSNLFEACEPTPRGRGRHIEQLIAQGRPTFGYFCLSQLLSQSYVDTVVTTNFDDLVYESCARWTGIRPRIYAYGTPGGPISHEAGRPTILKLHGDFLYSRLLRSTDSEVAQPDLNMQTQVRRLVDDYELVVIGYAGNDGSIVEILKAVPDDSGVYWCVHGDRLPSEEVQVLMAKRPYWFLVRTEGFEQVMDEFLFTVGFSLPNMEQTLQEQSQSIVSIISESDSSHKNHFLGQAQESARDEDERGWIESRVEAMQAFSEGDFGAALDAWRRAVELHPDDVVALSDFGSALYHTVQTEEAISEYRRALEINPNDIFAIGNLAASLRHKGQVQESIVVAEGGLTLSPDNSPLINNLGVGLYMNGQRARAEQTFQRNVDLTEDNYSDDLEVQMQRGVALVGVGRGEEGLAIFLMLANRQPIPTVLLRRPLPDLRSLARCAVSGAQECVSVIEQALGSMEQNTS